MKNTNNKFSIALVIAIIGVTVALLHQYKGDIYAQMNAWKLIPQPELFTELYFNDHINLPKQIAKDEKISFAFVIHNLEGEKKEYPYIVYFKSQDSQITNIEKKSVTLIDGGYKTIEESYTAALLDNTGGIFVELQQKQQSIHFLLNNND